MLIELNIHNLVLIEEAKIPFAKGFNVVTGETGAGKSALMAALGLVVGERADVKLIREGAPKGSVLAIFDVEGLTHTRSLMEEHGIDHEEGSELTLSREITAQGKSRAFINNQLVQLQILKKIGESLVKIVGQHANQQLQQRGVALELLDLYGQLNPQKEAFRLSWEREKVLKEQIQELKNQEAHRLRDLERFQVEREEIEKAHVEEGEEEEVFTEYSRLKHADELLQYAVGAQEMFSDEGAFGQLARGRSYLEKLASLDPSFEDTHNEFKTGMIHLRDVAFSIERYAGSIENSPERAQELEDRLSLINVIKRKYGPELVDVHAYHQEIVNKLFTLENADEKMASLHKELGESKTQNNALAHELSKKRATVALEMSQRIEHELRLLKMEMAHFEVSIQKGERTQSGDDAVVFLLQPNVGEKKLPLGECASGGELSRVMLALQVTMAHQEAVSCLVFDEIDANIGGETATVVGKQLKQMGEALQVVTITHFPQVATQADHHLQISKLEKGGRTHTLVTSLAQNERKKELTRMRG